MNFQMQAPKIRVKYMPIEGAFDDWSEAEPGDRAGNP
jgi:hypothetical protein